jgi:hypothetical protein
MRPASRVRRRFGLFVVQLQARRIGEAEQRPGQADLHHRSVRCDERADVEVRALWVAAADRQRTDLMKLDRPAKSDGTEAGTVMVKDITPGPALTGFSSLRAAVGSGGSGRIRSEGPTGRRPARSRSSRSGLRWTIRTTPSSSDRRCSSSPSTMHTDGSCGGATARRAAPRSSRISIPAPVTGSTPSTSSAGEATSTSAETTAFTVSSCGGATGPRGGLAWSGTSTPAVRAPTPTPPGWKRSAAGSFSLRTTMSAAASCGRATELAPARSWSRTSPRAGRRRSRIGAIVRIEDKLALFSAFGEGSLHKTDGTAKGTKVVRRPRDGGPGYVAGITRVQGLGALLSGYSALWKSDGTRAGTVQILGLAPAEITALGSSGRCSSRTTGFTVRSCGSPTEPPAEPTWSKTSNP